jgi:hypothetical protein
MATDRKQEIKDLTDGQKGKQANIDFWQQQLDNAKRVNELWLTEALDNYRIYYNTTLDSHGSYKYSSAFPGNKLNNHSYNLFYSNIETKRPLLYSKLPNLDIRRRYRDKDRISKITSELLERTCNYFLDNYNYDIHFKKVVLDKLVSGRGLARLVFESGFVEREEEGETIEEIDINLKKIRIEFVPYDRVLMETAKRWEDVSWIAFKHQLSKGEVAQIIGKKKAEQLNYPESVLTGIEFKEKTGHEKEELKVINTRITVWEIWDKEQKKIILFAPTSDIGILKETDDIYNLEGFYPIPRPLGLLSNNISTIPIPEFRQYKIQYLELQEVEDRIRLLVKQAKACGAYNDKLTSEDASNFLNRSDGVMTPVGFPVGQRIEDYIYMKPIEAIVNTINTLLVQKAQIINDIREITGISDIVRGTTEAQETATAQKLKGDFAISRMQIDQQEVEFYIRDVLKLMVELIAENYTVEELTQISGLEVIDLDQVGQKAQQQAIQQVQQAEQQKKQRLTEEEETQIIQQAQQQAIQEVQSILKTTFSATSQDLPEIDRMLKVDKLRDFNIDIETESTIKLDNDIEKAQRIELLNALAGTLNQLAPLQQANLLTDDAVREMIGFIIRPFKVGRNLEEALLEKQDTTAQEQQQQALQQAELQIQMEERVHQPNRELDIKQQEVDDKRTIEQAKLESNELKTEVESDTDIAVAEISAESRKQSNDNKKEK